MGSISVERRGMHRGTIVADVSSGNSGNDPVHRTGHGGQGQVTAAAATGAVGEDGPGPSLLTATAVPTTDWLDAAFRAHYVSLVRLATLLVDRNVAEEIVQDAFVRTYGRLHRVDPDKVPQYLRAAVVNGSRSRLRRREVRRRHQPDKPIDMQAAEVAAVAGTERDAMLQRLDTLPARQREVLLLRYYLDLSEQEIAAALGIALGSVKTHAHRGLAALADRMEAPT